MQFEDKLAKSMLDEELSKEARQLILESLQGTQPDEWLDVFANTIGLTILSLPTQPVFRVAVRLPHHDTDNKIAHMLLVDEYEDAASAVGAGLEFAATRPTLEHLTGVVSSLVVAVAQVTGVNLLTTKAKWFSASEDEQIAHFVARLRSRLD